MGGQVRNGEKSVQCVFLRRSVEALNESILARLARLDDTQFAALVWHQPARYC